MASRDTAFPDLGALVRALTGLDLPLPIPMFGLLVVIAMLVAGVAFRSELRRRYDAGGLTPATSAADGDGRVGSRAALDEWVLGFLAWMLLAGILGSRLFSVLEHPGRILQDPLGQLLSRNGFNVIGGLLLATAVGIVLIRRAGLRVLPVLDAAGPAMMLGYAVGRIGCQLSGDGDWGRAADPAGKPGWLPSWLWAQQYEGNVLGVTIPPPGVHPTPIWETAAGIVLFAVLWSLRRRLTAPGRLFSLYIVLAALERLAIEPLRVNETYGPLHASQAQYLSGILLVVGVVGLVLTRRNAASAQSTR